VFGCSDTAGTGRLGGLQGGDTHQRTNPASEPPDDVPSRGADADDTLNNYNERWWDCGDVRIRRANRV
jgi:hypothetical protein